ncbi:steroid dehydrogenase [Penicillium macrosclerotiorum]|uniref:steroid dehydrogenase n=1 Tax=Penicillium macrosclerotiorum TaxID=303699 RepID=UPI0025475038|nr:steroid dehydrogenase [Penicillium macrosclerotiorum]KAJ5679256.1 steroid dehydrogenase [Penicillium macrosclerotiorum]
MGVTFSQFFPPAPTLTEANLPTQKGKVFIVTGGYSGIGFELCTILYEAGGKVYLAGRSEEKSLDAIRRIKASNTSSQGDIIYLPIQLDDLTTIKPAVEAFTKAESRLDVLFNNAGVSNPPRGSVSPQGHDLQLATNCLGPHLLTQLLLSTLKRTAENQPPASVRVVWTSSIVVDMSTPGDGVRLHELQDRKTHPQRNYENTKLGNWFLANALSSQAGADGILSVTVNPGNLKSALTRHFSPLVPFLVSPLLYPARKGAYTSLWAGLSDELKISDGGKYIIPWGRVHPSPRKDLVQAMNPREDGERCNAQIFIDFCNEETMRFV